METTNASPKLTWFQELHKAFSRGKIKSFTKTPLKKPKSEAMKEKMIEIEYQEVTGESSGEEEGSLADDKHLKKAIKKQEKEEHQIIIEPLEVDYDEESYHEESAETRPNNASNNNLTSSPASTSTFAGTGMLSNELFLKSLQATLDRLPDAKNMRARIKIQEALYTIAYEMEQ